ncbi:MAG: SRPBCC family protein, partial [Methyloligellaceae bacterium]
GSRLKGEPPSALLRESPRSSAFTGFKTAMETKMLLEDRILIDAPPSRVFAFFDEMAANYTDWHPDHILFEWRTGRGAATGNVFYFEETIAGELQRKEVVFTEVERDRAMVFAPTNRFFWLFLPRISFQMCETPLGTELIAQVVVRMGPIAAWLHRRELAAVRRHMREECQNLKRMVEAPRSRSCAA